MLLKRWLLALAGGMLILAGCATTGEPVDPKDATVSLVYGYFDMKQAPSDLRWVSLKKYGNEPGYYQVGAKDGYFWHVGVEPGSYQVDTFGGVGGIPILTQKEYRYNFGTRGRNETAVRIQRPGVYFMGAYKYVDHPGGFLEADKFEMKAVKTPSEREVLQRLITELESDPELKIYTRQIAYAKKRLADLSR